MDRRRGFRSRLLAVLAVVVGMSIGPVVVPSPAIADEAAQVLFLLDVSGSMNQPIASGGTKFAAAQRALKRVADAVPAGTQVGLRVYGSEIAERANPDACVDTKLVLPIGPLDRGRLNQAVDSFSAKGETPIAYSLGTSVEDFAPSGKRVLILISDGEESCGGDPCPVARKLADAGVDLQFNAIGLTVDGKARQQLQCIASAGGGSYYDAADTTELEEAVRKITQRALRPFQTSGVPVTATVDVAGAPEIGPGQYKDTYDTSNTRRYYRVARTPGSTVTASIASIVWPLPSQNRDFWTMTLATRDGTVCATTTATASAFKVATVISDSVSSAQLDRATRKSLPAGCASEPELLLSLARQSGLGNRDPSSVELVIAEEPAVVNLATLPEAESGYLGKADAVPAGGATPDTLGGTSFSNAPQVGPGSWRDSMAVGERVFYRVRLETGQRLRVTAETPEPGSDWRLDGADVLTARLDVYSPARTSLTFQTGNLQGRITQRITAASPQVRVRNREVPPPGYFLDPSVTTAAVAGDYFVALQLDPLQAFLLGRVMTVRLSLAVDGTPSGAPEYARSTPVTTALPPTGAAAPPTDDAMSPVPILAAAGVLAGLVLVTVLVVALRRRRR